MKKILFITTAIIVVVLILIIFIFSMGEKGGVTPPRLESPTPIPVKVSIPTPTTSAENLVVDKNALLQKLPIQTDTYNIQYIASTDTFVVTIKESPLEINKQQANKFFYENGVKDLSKLNIAYNSYRWVQ